MNFSAIHRKVVSSSLTGAGTWKQLGFIFSFLFVSDFSCSALPSETD